MLGVSLGSAFALNGYPSYALRIGFILRRRKVLSTTLSSKHQVVIPKPVRDALGLGAGQKFTLLVKGEVIALVPVRGLAWARGRLKGADVAGVREHEDRA